MATKDPSLQTENLNHDSCQGPKVPGHRALASSLNLLRCEPLGLGVLPLHHPSTHTRKVTALSEALRPYDIAIMAY